MTFPRRARLTDPARIKREDHDVLWRAIESAVVDVCRHHPDYLTPKGADSICTSVTKRAVGNVLAMATEARKGGCESGWNAADGCYVSGSNGVDRISPWGREGLRNLSPRIRSIQHHHKLGRIIRATASPALSQAWQDYLDHIWAAQRALRAKGLE